MARSAPLWWASRGWQALAWLPLGMLFSLVATIRRRLYRAGWLRTECVRVPVVVVGNLAAGGSGKTPVVLWLVDALRACGWTPGVVSRGYGGRIRGPAGVDPDSDPRQFGDEPVLIARRSGAPVWIGRDRPAAARALLEVFPEVDVLVCDDGLQHYRLARDAELIVVDARVLGNRWPLPAGPMREPVGRLADATLVLLHGSADAQIRAGAGAVRCADMHLVPGRFYRLGAPDEQCDAAAFAGRALKAVAGIGHPQRFFDTLSALGLDVRDRRAFPDHHAFSASDLSLAGADVLLMTEKDAIKCAGFAPRETWVLPVSVQIDPAALVPILESLHGSEAA